MQVIVILASSLRTRWTASLLILYLYSRFFPSIYCVSISWPLPSAERHGRASPSPGGSFFRISLPTIDSKLGKIQECVLRAPPSFDRSQQVASS